MSESTHPLFAFLLIDLRLYPFPSVHHLLSGNGADDHLDIFPEGVMVQVVTVDTYLVGIDHGIVILLRVIDGS